MQIRTTVREFPGSPVVRIQCFHCWGWVQSLNPCLGTKIPQATWSGKKTKKQNKPTLQWDTTLYLLEWLLWKKKKGLPWWYSGWESACQCRGHEFKPWSGKIPHAAEQLGPWATTTEPARLDPVLQTREATIVRGPRTAMKSGPRSPQLEKALAQKQRPNTAKNK